MAKGNGSTRASTTSNMYGSENASVDLGMTPAQFQSRFVDTIANGEYPAGWDELDTASRELALMEAGFTGYSDEDAENILFPETKDRILMDTVDAVINDFDFGPKVNESTYITIAYKDGTTKSIGSLGSEIETTRPLSKGQSYTTQEKIVRQSLRVRDIAYITHNNSYNEVYWIAKDGESRFLKDTGYEKWTKGRGTRRRDYIQDDWI